MSTFPRRPTNDANWSPDQKVLTSLKWHDDGETVEIQNLRRCYYRSVSDYDVTYYDQTINLNEVRRVWFLLEPFSLVAAHTLLSFEFADGTYLSASVEIRKRVGQKFSQLMVLFFLRRHELMYVLGDERDLIELRTNHRRDTTYLYPLNLSSSEAQAVLRDILHRSASLAENPEFYHPFTNTCFTNLKDHINKATTRVLPFDLRIWLATMADRYLYQNGLIDQINTPFSILKLRWHINLKAEAAGGKEDFSQQIRA